MNENEGTVRLLLPESMVISLLGVLGQGITMEVANDLGLDELYETLADEFGRVSLEGANNVIGRATRDVPASVTLRSRPRYTSIDLT